MNAPSISPLPRQILAPVKGAGGRVWAFLKAVWNDNDFWVRAIAVKCSASTVIAMGVIFITSTVALPFLASAAFIAVSSAIAALCLYGIIAGGASAWLRLKSLYHRHIKGDFSGAAAVPMTFSQRMAHNIYVQRFLQSMPVQKFLNSRTWKTTRNITRKQQDILLAGIAGSGSLAWSIASVAIIISQIALLPVVAVGGILTLTTALAIGGLVSGCYGIYISAEKLVRRYQDRKKPEAARAEACAAADTHHLPVILQEKERKDIMVVPVSESASRAVQK